MSTDFLIKQNDTSPKLVYVLDPPVPLGGATAVFNMYPVSAPKGTSPLNRVPALIEDPDGALGHVFTADQTSVAGVFWGEFEVTYADESVETFPNKGYITIKIGHDLG